MENSINPSPYNNLQLFQLQWWTFLKERDIELRNTNKIRRVAKLKNTLDNNISESQLNEFFIQKLMSMLMTFSVPFCHLFHY